MPPWGAGMVGISEDLGKPLIWANNRNPPRHTCLRFPARTCNYKQHKGENNVIVIFMTETMKYNAYGVFSINTLNLFAYVLLVTQCHSLDLEYHSMTHVLMAWHSAWHSWEAVESFTPQPWGEQLCPTTGSHQDVLPHHRSKSNRANQPWIETSKSVSQNKPSLFKNWSSQIFCHHNRKLTNTHRYKQ